MIGQIQIYTGNGKGKTTAALGLALRAAGQNKKVSIIFFDKGYPTGEYSSLSHVTNIEFYHFGKNRMRTNGSFRLTYNKEDKEQQGLALALANRITKQGQNDILILDEILQKNIETKKILEIIQNKPQQLELILTGRFCESEISQQANLITEMKKVKHYFDQGIKARAGIEY